MVRSVACVLIVTVFFELIFSFPEAENQGRILNSASGLTCGTCADAPLVEGKLKNYYLRIFRKIFLVNIFAHPKISNFSIKKLSRYLEGKL